jgi:hypothetical protein
VLKQGKMPQQERNCQHSNFLPDCQTARLSDCSRRSKTYAGAPQSEDSVDNALEQHFLVVDQAITIALNL